MIRVSFQKILRQRQHSSHANSQYKCRIYIILKIQEKFPLPKFSQNEVDTSLLYIEAVILYINLTSNFSKLYRLLTLITLVMKGYFSRVTIFHVDESEDAQSLA